MREDKWISRITVKGDPKLLTVLRPGSKWPRQELWQTGHRPAEQAVLLPSTWCHPINLTTQLKKCPSNINQPAKERRRKTLKAGMWLGRRGLPQMTGGKSHEKAAWMTQRETSPGRQELAIPRVPQEGMYELILYWCNEPYRKPEQGRSGKSEQGAQNSKEMIKQDNC